MLIKSIIVGFYEVNCYIAGCDIHKEAVLIDPGDQPDKILQCITDNNVNVKYIINTHAHADHIGAVSDVKKKLDAKYMLHEKDMIIANSQAARDMIQLLGSSIPPQPDELIKEEITLDLCCDLSIKILHIPGHSPGGISMLIDGCVFTGDSLFAGSIGRTDFPLSSHDDLISSIKTKLLVMDDNIKVYPGHGPDSTIGNERKYNTFLTS